MCAAGRSLTLPPGPMCSHLARMRQPVACESERSSTSGVLPIVSSSPCAARERTATDDDKGGAEEEEAAAAAAASDKGEEGGSAKAVVDTSSAEAATTAARNVAARKRRICDFTSDLDEIGWETSSGPVPSLHDKELGCHAD